MRNAPMRQLLPRKPNPVSSDLRRDLGIWAGISALAHTAVGLNVHLRGRMWLYFVDTRHHLRRDVFGFGNYTGVLAALVFALLLALSNDVSLRRLGVDRWKSLQRWAYAGIALTAAHAIAYQYIEKRTPPFQAVLYIVFGIVLAFQIVAAFGSQQGARGIGGEAQEQKEPGRGVGVMSQASSACYIPG